MKYESEVQIDPEKLQWFPEVEKPTVEYNMSPFKPSDIKKALGKKDKTSAPGYDYIIYEYLFNMPHIHKVLATVFTMIRDTGKVPDIWGCIKVKLIHKNGNIEEPSNFIMIALTLNIAKLYHTLEAERTIQFMISNNYIDPQAQKAYMDRINGCVEHITVVHEIIQHAKLNNRTAHISWLDLEDAFGSLSHKLIPYVMKYYNIPETIITCITSLYTKLEGTVETKNWTSETFKVKKGAFQGDPYSGIIFLVAFNPIIQYIKKHNENQGYQIKLKDKSVKNVITTPFADDFNIISRNIKQHQKLLSGVQSKINSMKLVLKPSKCRSLSIQNGKQTNVSFFLTKKESQDKYAISSVIDKPFKFLGS